MSREEIDFGEPLTLETRAMMSATFAPVLVVGTYVTLRMIAYLQCGDSGRRRGKTDIDELVLFEQGGESADDICMP